MVQRSWWFSNPAGNLSGQEMLLGGSQGQCFRPQLVILKISISLVILKTKVQYQHLKPGQCTKLKNRLFVPLMAFKQCQCFQTHSFLHACIEIMPQEPSAQGNKSRQKAKQLLHGEQLLTEIPNLAGISLNLHPGGNSHFSINTT